MKDNTAQVVAQVPVDVGSFLLNEKRSDVLGIETRFKVNVLLVPNRHLETPNFNVERLRHDDLNQSEPLPPSYEMVVKPEVEDVAKQIKEEAKEPRQEAVVKGITPAQPAPMPVERPRELRPASAAPVAQSSAGSWFDRMLGWFRKPVAEIPAPAAAPQPAPVPVRQESRDRRDRRDQRGEPRRDREPKRDERRGEGRGDRRDDRREQRGQQKEPRAAQGQQAQAKREGAAAEGRREPQQRREGQRSPKPQAPREPAADEPALTAGVGPGVAVGAPGGDGEPKREGGRRRRGRRGRGGDRPVDGDRAVPTASGAAAASSASDALLESDASATKPHEPAPLPVIEAASVPPEPATRNQTPEPTPAWIEPAHETAPVAEPKPAELFAPKPEREVRPPPILEIPPVQLTLPADSGLVLVETAGDRARAMPMDEPESPRPKRVRPPRIEIPSEPLEMVETSKEAPPPPA